MKIFEDLGLCIEDRWREKNYSEEIFPDLAAEALAEAKLCGRLSPWEIVSWVHAEPQLPRQIDLDATFGNPPITLFCGHRFYIDIYFWLDGTTDVHQHAFAGAFQVFTGSSIHSHYTFEEKRKINERFLLGDIVFDSVELLKQGDIRKIIPGKEHIHSLFHLDQPSTTITVRTLGLPFWEPQYAYKKPHLAIDPFYKEPSLIRKLQTVAMLFHLRQPQYYDLVADVLVDSDFQGTFLILQTVFAALNSNKLEKFFELSNSGERFASMLAKARERHGDLVDFVPPVLQEFARQTDIIQRRQFITTTEHRFFLALLLNVPSRDKVFELVKERYPEKTPLDTVLDWVTELSTTKVWGSIESNVLGIDDFDDDYLFVLEHLLQDLSNSQIKDSLEKHYPAAQGKKLEARIDEIVARLRDSSIFKAILSS